MIILRSDQSEIKRKIYENWNTGDQNICAVSPTGSGKSIITSDIALDIARMNEPQAIIAHRNELVSQMSLHVARRGIPHRIIASDQTVSSITRMHRETFKKSYINPSANAAVVGVDTLISRSDKLKDWANQISYWTIDEGHHVLRENKWGKAVEMFPRARGLGVTATPCRADGKGLGRLYDGVYDSMVVGLDMRSLMRINALSDYEIVCPTSDLEIDDKEVSKDGDWSPHKLKAAAKESRIVGDAVNAYCNYAYGRQTIVFATDIETSNDIAKRFNDAGIRAASLSSHTNPAVREKYINEFRAGILKILVNVDLFDEGFDVPACDVVMMARPTASLGKYRQMVGRALRYIAGKIALIIDLVSNIVRHGLPDKFIEWTLARRDKRAKQEKDPEQLEITVCKNPICLKPYEKFRLCCPYCGSTPPLPEPRDRNIKVVEGDLILLTREKLEEMRRAIVLESPADFAARAPASENDYIARGLMNKQIEKFGAHDRLKAAIAQWAGIQRHMGLNDREIQKKFYHTLGVDVLSALDGSKTRKEFDDLAEKIEGWYK